MRLVDLDDPRIKWAEIVDDEGNDITLNLVTNKFIPVENIIVTLKVLKRYLSAPVIYIDGKSGYYCIKSGGTKQGVYERMYNAGFFLKDFIDKLEEEYEVVHR